MMVGATAGTPAASCGEAKRAGVAAGQAPRCLAPCLLDRSYGGGVRCEDRPMTTERREAPRTRVQLPVRIKGTGMIRWAETMMRDLSTMGFRCTMYGAFWPVGTRVSFEMPLFPAADPFTGMAQVIHMGEVPYSDQYYVGLEFSNLSPDALRQLGLYLKPRGAAPGAQ